MKRRRSAAILAAPGCRLEAGATSNLLPPPEMWDDFGLKFGLHSSDSDSQKIPAYWQKRVRIMHLIRRLPDSGALTMPMHKFLRRAIAAASLCVLAASVAFAKHTKTVGASSKEASTYDEARDPAKDLQAAIGQAQKAHKRILLEVGGDWCMYCNIMDETFDGHPNLKRLLLPEEWQGFPLRKDYDILQQDEAWVRENLGIESGQ